MTAANNTYPYGTYPYGQFPASWVTSSTPVALDEVTVTCPHCCTAYSKRAASAAEAERACQVWLRAHRAIEHDEPGPQPPADEEPEPEHATMDDGTQLRHRTAGSLGLCGNGVGPSSRGLLKLAAEHLEAAVLEPGKTTLDEADMTAIATLARHALDS